MADVLSLTFATLSPLRRQFDTDYQSNFSTKLDLSGEVEVLVMTRPVGETPAVADVNATALGY